MMWLMETVSLISLAEASKLYKVSRRTIDRLIKRGGLPYHRIGRQIRVSPSDLHEATCRHASIEPVVTAYNALAPQHRGLDRTWLASANSSEVRCRD